MYKYLFGPVPSRRLGVSLGVDLVPPKTCSLNCIYCECGRTTKLTLEREEYIPVQGVKTELAHYFSHHPQPDYITFSGSGEPTLNSGIGDVLKFIKQQPQDYNTAILSNGTLFRQKTVRDQVLGADVIIPSLDAATPAAFRKINNPHPEMDLNEIIFGLIRLRKEYRGQIWLEVFIVPGMNDSEEELAALKDAIERIAPDRVQLNTLDRPGTVSDIRAATQAELKSIIDYWGLDAEIIAKAPVRKEIPSFRDDVESAILETIARRPCTLQDLQEILGLHVNEIKKYLDVLEAEAKIRVARQARGIFYQIGV
ncbi:MAG TPA: radical SAM protein [Myxococcota bacterium]|nr:radical SAM protein [Myxococcota bacterium]